MSQCINLGLYLAIRAHLHVSVETVPCHTGGGARKRSVCACEVIWGMFPVAQRQAAVLSKAVVAMDARRGSLKLNLSTLMKVFKWKWHFSSVMMKYNKIQAWFIVGCEISHGNFFVSQLVTTHSNCFMLSHSPLFTPPTFSLHSLPLYTSAWRPYVLSHILHFLYLYF